MRAERDMRLQKKEKLQNILQIREKYINFM